MIRGIDFSNYGGPIDEYNLGQVINSQDLQRIIIAAQFPATFNAAFEAAMKNDLEVEAYIYLYNHGGNWASQVEAAQNIIHNAPIRRLWLDVEDTIPPFPNLQTSIDSAIRACRFPAGIYTGAWFWSPYTGNLQFGDRVPLWVADYDNNPEVINDVDFGGWITPHAKQYAGEFSSFGLTFGLDCWRE